MRISSRGYHLDLLKEKDCDQDPSPRTDFEFETPIDEETEAGGDSHRKNFFTGSRNAPSFKLRTKSVSRFKDRRPEFKKSGNWQLLSATSQALLARLKGSGRSGIDEQDLKPRSVTLLRHRNSSPTRGGNNGGRAPSRYFWRPVVESKKYNKDNSSPGASDQDAMIRDLNVGDSIQGSEKNQLSNIFDDDAKSEVFYAEEETKTSGNRERSASASTLMASTLARQKVEYLIMICKAVKAYASTQTEKLKSVSGGQHMINQLRDVASDVHRQHDKILAVYDATEVRRSVDRLEETLKDVYELLGNIEDTALMFGKKKGFGKRISALVHGIGTYSNALLVATSLAIADRPNILYTADTGGGEPPAPQKEELVRMCIEGDKYFFGRGERPSVKKAFEAYAWAAERGGVEAMVVLASMYRAGTHVEADKEKCHSWLERAVDKGYAPAMNDLAVVLLGEADRLEEAHPELKSGILSSEIRETDGSNEDDTFLQNAYEGVSSLCGRDRPMNGLEGDYHESRDEAGGGTKSGWTPEQDKLFEQIMKKRKRSMLLLQEAAKTGHTDAITNLGNMQEAMGYFDDARNCYSIAAEPSESANNPRAQNYLGALYFGGRGVTKDLNEAVKWFRRSTLQGNAQACKNLGICYQAGLGVAKDQSKAVQLLHQAVELGSVSATNDLAYVLARDALHALAAVTRQAPACHHSDTSLKFEDPPTGTINSGGSSSKASRKVWRDSTAQLREASDLFRRAAESGISDASYQLGMLYRQGLGIPLDPVAAFENFLAAANGSTVHPAAAACVGDLLYSGTGCLRDYREALRYYLRAANAGEPTSANAVGLMYELGRGVPRNSKAALEWYIRAASLGSADGAFNGALLLERGDPMSAIASAAGLAVFPEKHLGASLLSPSTQLSPGAGSGLSSLARAQEKCLISDPSRAASDSARHKQQTSGDERVGYHNRGRSSSETQPHNQRPGQGGLDKKYYCGDRNQNPHNHETPLAAHRCRHSSGNGHGDRASPEDDSGSVKCHRADEGHQCLHSWELGNRQLAMQMFERAAELGHPGAVQEIHRVRLRDKMDHLERMGKQSQSTRAV